MSVHRATIEHPKTSANKRILDNLTTVYTVALNLSDDGFKVITVDASKTIPQIVLAPTGHCKKLDNKTIYKKGRDQFGYFNIYKALKGGCELLWKTRDLTPFQSNPKYH